MHNNILTALGLSLFAGLSTGIGGLLTLFWKKTNKKLLSVILGFSAGVMIYISFVELYHESQITLAEAFGERSGSLISAVSFFGGMLVIAIIDKLIPSYENPHETHSVEETEKCDIEAKNKNLLRTGILTALAITIHNFPEGMATFTSAMKKPSLGIAIAVAIAIHNIPEGIAVAVPIFCSTGSKKRGFVLSLLSGLAEPFGALIAYLILMPFLNNTVFGILFAAIAGIMVFISFDELLPTAREYGEHHLSIYGLIGGMVIMAFSLILFM